MSIDRVLSWFPNTWRSRYEVEVRELLKAHPFTWRERRDLLRACADAWWRETTSWGLAITKFSTAVGVRIAVVLTLGWLGVRGAEALLPPDVVLGWWPAVESGTWRSVMTLVKIITFVVVARYVMRPYDQSLDPRLRPTWLQTGGWVLFFSLLIVTDGRRGGLAEILWMGIFAMMRFSPWLQLFGEHPQARPTVLGLR